MFLSNHTISRSLQHNTAPNLGNATNSIHASGMFCNIWCPEYNFKYPIPRPHTRRYVNASPHSYLLADRNPAFGDDRPLVRRFVNQFLTSGPAPRCDIGATRSRAPALDKQSNASNGGDAPIIRHALSSTGLGSSAMRSNYTVSRGGDPHRSNLILPRTLQLVVCFESIYTCRPNSAPPISISKSVHAIHSPLLFTLLIPLSHGSRHTNPPAVSTSQAQRSMKSSPIIGSFPPHGRSTCNEQMLSDHLNVQLGPREV